MQAVSTHRRRRPVLEVTLACLGVLLLAQALIGALSLSSLDRLITDTTADRVEVAVRHMTSEIENGLRLGKPLGQFFGLDEILQDGMGAARGAGSAAVALADGRTVLARGEAMPRVASLAQAAAGAASDRLPEGIARRPDGAVIAASGGLIAVAVPLANSSGRQVGAVMLSASVDTTAARRLFVNNVSVLCLVTLAVGLGLAAVFKYFIPLTVLASGGRARFLVPLSALVLAQGIYAGYTIVTFRDAAVSVEGESIDTLGQTLQRDLNRVLGYGIAPDRLKGVESPFTRLAAGVPSIRHIDLVDESGRVLNRADAHGALPVEGLSAEIPRADDYTRVLPLGAANGARASLVLHLDDRAIAAGVRSRVIDAATVALVSLVAAVEMLLLLSSLMNRAFSVRGRYATGDLREPDDESEIGRIARPVMFGFLFSWALPLGFLPLYARSLPAGGLHLPPNLLLALPISVEMACGLLTSLLAGRLTDRKGWHVPVLAGLAVSVAGLAACAAAHSLPWFVAARGLVGLGYGLTWMGLQGFIVTCSPPAYRGRNMMNVIAGLFAGHLAGAAVGAMLMEQLGFRAVFAVGAVMLLLPWAGVSLLMRPYMRRAVEKAPTSVASAAAARTSLAATLRLLFTRDFGLLLLGSVIPFSIAQVGLLSFALPLYLEAQGTAASSIGRVLMIYGICVIYVGPLMGRLADRTHVKKPWIVAGGVIGSAGLLGLYFASGLAPAALAVLLLAVASCFSGASQSPYMLALPDVQRYGAAGATSVMRAADKLGQMAGPLVVGTMFGAAGMGAGLALTGAIYLVATLLFLLFAPGLASAEVPEPSSR
jgi:predicted MFS family arabinose efflux permease